MNKKNRVGTREGVGRVAGVLRKVLTFTALARRRPSFLGDSAPGRRRSVRCSSHVSGEARKRGSTFVSVIMLSPSTSPPESAPASLVLYYMTPSPVPIPGFFDLRTSSRRRRRAHRPCESAQMPRINPFERPRTATLISAHRVLLFDLAGLGKSGSTYRGGTRTTFRPAHLLENTKTRTPPL